MGGSGESLREAQKYNRGACDQTNRLHFYVENCAELRYSYWVVSSSDNAYEAVAHSPQDEPYNTILPFCEASGSGSSRGDKFTVTASSPPEHTLDVAEQCD